ncbi:MAG: ABC transporter substrate-binding protein [Spirochaetota bacterium]
MRRTLLAVTLVLVAGLLFATGVQEEGTGEVKNPDTLIYATYGTIESLDPAKAYDTASWTNMTNIYEQLVAFEGESTADFVPVLAAEVPTVENGGITNDGRTFRIRVRDGVLFHDGTEMTPEDVEYSFERNLVVDTDGGPNWIWWYLFTGDKYSSRDGDGNIVGTWDEIDNAVEVDGDYVVFNLASPAPYFLGVLAGQWASIINKDFVAANGGWDGTEATWKDYNNPPEDGETLWDIANGTGPYAFTRWEKGVELVIDRFDDYWGDLPEIKTGIYRVMDEWTTRKLALLQGDADMATVDAVNFPEMDQETGLNVYQDLPSLTIGGITFNMDITAENNPYIYSGQLDGEGVPPDFFSDINVRKAFIAAWDQQTYIEDITNNTYQTVVTPVPYGLPFKNESVEMPPHDLDAAAEYMRQAWDGEVWEKGFKVDLLFNTGNDVRQASVRMMAEAISSLNPKFEINVRGVEWSEYLNLNRSRSLPVFYIGWAPDYPDPDNYVYPYMHSTGTYAGRQGYNNPEVDDLIERGATSLDTDERREIYYRLQEIWIEDAPGIIPGQPLSRRYMKDWVQGHYYNPMQSSMYDLLPELSKAAQ